MVDYPIGTLAKVKFKWGTMCTGFLMLKPESAMIAPDYRYYLIHNSNYDKNKTTESGMSVYDHEIICVYPIKQDVSE